ncbi:uncharacterized protein LOC115949082 [Geospiza fortis]|uniref:Uncharacterized protein LOC115949082 n=1 Tax=Geospiza fortis TaxID=48883 RepID=A0A8N5F0F5_GEOFO|nr:uncharacterized protein LOC115949082 [Geospiza fortis]XP_030921225.1 uncharacterized protein LOC115949082 [Geospiza fortis]
MGTLRSGVVNTLIYRIVLYVVIIEVLELESTFVHRDAEWPWSQAFNQYTGSMGELSEVKDLNLSTVVIHRNQVYEKLEWQERKLWTLQGIRGEEIKVGCRIINGTAYERPDEISVSISPDVYEHQEVCDSLNESDCWCNFTLIQPVEVTCIWARNTVGLSFKFKIDTTLFTTAGPHTRTTTDIVQTQPKLEPEVYEIGPYVVRNVGEQQLLFNPEWSLKRVELLMQINISKIQPACSSFLKTSFEGWTTWLQRQVYPRNRIKKDLTGILGTGLGVLNGIDSEILMNKLTTAASGLTKLKQPLESSLLALGTSQWQISKVLPEWEETGDHDQKLIVEALSAVQDNVSLAFSCIHAQLWMQATAALIIREGGEGNFPAEIRKIVWDNAIDFERKFQSWWTMVNFTYDPVSNVATAFVLLYPSEHRMWARKVNEKWQTVNLESCITKEQVGFICESNTINAQDVCLDTEQSICHFEIHPVTDQKTVLVYTGKRVCVPENCLC